MVDPTDHGERIERRDDLDEGDAGVFAYWQMQENIAEKEERNWIKKAREIVKRYRDERPESIQNTNRFNILWSNVQTLIPTLYGRTPKPDVERRFKDQDPVARLASILLERCLAYSCDAADDVDFDDVVEAVVEDRLLPGRGVARVLYIPHYGDEIKDGGRDERTEEGDNAEFENAEAAASVIDNSGDDEDEGKPLREVVYEEVIPEYVFWEDYREGPARKWREVPWIRFRSYLTRDELVTRFGKEKGEQVNLDYTPKGAPADSVKDEPPADIYKKAIVFEVWDKTKLQVIWYAPATPDLILDTKDDPLKLPGFFPVPQPLRSTSTNDKRTPVPDYIEYQDQARELDSLTARIDRLARALRVAGVYAGDEKQVLQQLIDEGTDNRLIPVGDVTSWAEKGGLGKIIEWVPIQQIAETLIQLYNARDRVKATLYELTGIGDIMRGMTEPDETLGAQRLKANFATRRISPQQKKVAKFARNLLRLMAGVIAEHFSAKTISMITGFPQLQPVPQLPPQPQPPAPRPMLPAPATAQPQTAAPNGVGAPAAAPPPDPAMQAYQQQLAAWQQQAQQAQAIQQQNQQLQQQFDAAVGLIKQDGIHGFRIDIEADSTIAPDEEQEKTARVEFLQQMIPMLEQVVPIAQGNPALASLAKEMTLFAARGFRVARPLEEAFEKAFDAIAQMPPQQPPGQQGKGGPDSPADLAVRTKQIQEDAKEAVQKLQIAQENNAVKMMQMNQNAKLESEKLAAEDLHRHLDRGVDLEKLASSERLQQARTESIESKQAARLT